MIKKRHKYFFHEILSLQTGCNLNFPGLQRKKSLGLFHSYVDTKHIHARVPQHTQFYVYSGLENHLYCGVCLLSSSSQHFSFGCSSKAVSVCLAGHRMGCEELQCPAQSVLTRLSECFQNQSIHNDATSLLLPLINTSISPSFFSLL